MEENRRDKVDDFCHGSLLTGAEVDGGFHIRADVLLFVPLNTGSMWTEASHPEPDPVPDLFETLCVT